MTTNRTGRTTMINNKQHRQNNRDTTTNRTGRTIVMNNKEYR
jgi:hypothetical protein